MQPTPSPRLLALILALAITSGAVAQETVIEIKAIAGLRYDVPRFKVAPGEKVKLIVENTDDMAHNLLITRPGARMEVANAAMTMPLTPTQDFIPKSDSVLWAIPVLTPGRKGEVRFTAPETEGVYPYVCTYPGHSMIMFGAMYVTRKEMPPLAQDPNVPDTAKAIPAGAALHAFTPQPPYFYRMFVRDSGPASFAVALPLGNNFVWDAGACRLRYAWRGAFLDPMPHWRGNGDAFAEVKGRIYWRAGGEFPLRLGAKDKVPAVKFRGYRLVNKHPEFRYELDGVEVRELIQSPHHGTGLESTFTLAAVKTPVFYIIDPKGGAQFTSSAGEFKDGVLTLTPEQARKFTVTLTEIPGREPLAYFSMDDVLAVKKPLPVEGVRGRALTFDGKKAQHDTGITTDALAHGATFALWVKAKDNAEDQVILGARAGDEEFAIVWNPERQLGFTFDLLYGPSADTLLGSSRGQFLTPPAANSDWHFFVATCDGESVTIFYDGLKIDTRATGIGRSLPAKAPIFLGSVGGAKFAAATLDEVRIYDRVLAEEEIRALYESDPKAGKTTASPAK